MTIFEKRVVAGSDDVEQSASGSVSTNSSDLELVTDGSTNQRVGLRFTSLDVPHNAVITNAYIQFQTDEVGSSATSLLIQGQDADDAAAFTTARNNVSSRLTTDASTAWTPAAWTRIDEAGLTQRTPDITAVVQEIVARPGWFVGNDMAFIFTGTGTRTARAFESGAGRAPLLHIEYTLDATPPPVNSPPDAVDDSASTQQNTAVRIPVLANDTDPNGDKVTVGGVTAGRAHGNTALNSDGTITYTPVASYLGDDAFTYSISDGYGGTDTATVTVSVTSAPPPPTTPFSGLVSPTVETAAVAGTGDMADDPAIWINRADPARSAVIGTDKDSSLGRLYVFDLQGNVLGETPAGHKFNNVDLRYDFSLGGKAVDLIGASNRGANIIEFFTIDPDSRQLTAVGSVDVGLQQRIYGFAMARLADGKYYAYVSTTGSFEDSLDPTQIRQFELDGSSGVVTGTAVRTLDPGLQVEGMVVDDRAGALYVAQEDVGVWRYGASPTSGSNRTQVDQVGTGRLKADVEGLTIYQGPDNTGYLIASSQGSDSYAVYDRVSNAYLGSFKVVDGNGIDGATDTDGLDVTNMALGTAFPKGLLVVHDNSNAGATSSNFKLVPWDSVAALGGLITAPTYNPLDGLLL